MQYFFLDFFRHREFQGAIMSATLSCELRVDYSKWYADTSEIIFVQQL